MLSALELSIIKFLQLQLSKDSYSVDFHKEFIQNFDIFGFTRKHFTIGTSTLGVDFSFITVYKIMASHMIYKTGAASEIFFLTKSQ